VITDTLQLTMSKGFSFFTFISVLFMLAVHGQDAMRKKDVYTLHLFSNTYMLHDYQFAAKVLLVSQFWQSTHHLLLFEWVWQHPTQFWQLAQSQMMELHL
jgi:hypothetical protein